MKRCCTEEEEPERTPRHVVEQAVFQTYMMRNLARLRAGELEAHEDMVAQMQSRTEVLTTGVTVTPNPASKRRRLFDMISKGVLGPECKKRQVVTSFGAGEGRGRRGKSRGFSFYGRS